MKRFLVFIILSVLTGGIVSAQTTDTAGPAIVDSVARMDTVVRTDSRIPVFSKDSIVKRPRADSGWAMIPATSDDRQVSWQIMQHHPWFGFDTKATYPVKQQFRKFTGKELLFYIMVALLIIFALLREAFPKYFGDLFRLFFRTTLKQRQIREQLMQTPLPSLLMNIFFVISAGLYTSFLLWHFGVRAVDNFWLLFFYCCMGLSAAYLVKFVGLKISGWIFNMPEAADSYIFIVFIVNKMIGIMLLPFLVLLAFTLGNIYSVSMTLSWCLVGILLLYRFILSFVAIRNQVRVNPFHFLLYLLAFEIAPLLLVYKALMQFFGETA